MKRGQRPGVGRAHGYDHTGIRERLMLWHDTNARTMPWRTEPRDPYAVWVSEVMLQQTRVVSVAPYYERFLRQFPDARALAGAPLDEVLGAWSGLGYYRRARALHAAARQVVEQFGGSLPRSIEGLLSLPGVGAYTAAAVGSIAFGLPAAVVDGNVCRVVARLFAIRTPLTDKATRAGIEQHTARLLDPSAPGAFNEAMMDLGAVVCTPRNPTCLMCPVRDRCEAFRESVQDELPVIPPRRASPRVECTTFVARCAQRTLLVRRRASGLFGGMWEPLTLSAAPEDARRAGAVRALGARRWTERGVVEHVLTHRVLVVRVLAATVGAMVVPEPVQLAPDYEQAAWCEDDRLGERGISVLARRVLRCATEARRGRTQTRAP